MGALRGADRRQLLKGRWMETTSSVDQSATEIASVLVQTWPERLEAAIGAVAALPHTEIYSRDAKGKFVVVIEAQTVGGIGKTLNKISSIPDVLNAALVFQGTDIG